MEHVWLVDPSARLVEVFETRAGQATLIVTAVDDESAALPPFPDLSVELSRLWLPRPTSPARQR